MQIVVSHVMSQVGRAAGRSRLLKALAVELWRLQGEVGTSIYGVVSFRAVFPVSETSRTLTPQQINDLFLDEERVEAPLLFDSASGVALHAC